MLKKDIHTVSYSPPPPALLPPPCTVFLSPLFFNQAGNSHMMCLGSIPDAWIPNRVKLNTFLTTHHSLHATYSLGIFPLSIKSPSGAQT